MMKRFFVTIGLVMAMTVLAIGQVNVNDERAIIDLAHKFATEAIINDAVVVKGVSDTEPKRITLAKDGEANPFELDQIKLQVEGNRATLVSRLVLSGQRANGEDYRYVHRWTVELEKQGGQWQVVRARVSNIGK